MSMPPYTVMCYKAGCSNTAAYKIAARWNDGLTHELKTYFLTCLDCLPHLLEIAIGKRAACHLGPGEVLDVPGVYELHRGDRDKQLRRRTDLETPTPSDAEPPKAKV